MRPHLFREILQAFNPRKSVGVDALAGLAADLVSGRGEASRVAMAEKLLASYSAASPEVRIAFLLRLAHDFGPDQKILTQCIQAYSANPGPETAINLHNAAESRRQELIRRMNLAPNAMNQLVRMRQDVLKNLKSNPDLALVDTDFLHLFSSWFNRGFLNLRRIDWSTPADILEKIIAYEAVHAIDSWDDLRLRLLPRDRRCFAFFHPTLPNDPLIFVEVALATDVPDAIAPLLAKSRAETDPAKVTTAIFYSISNCQKGLRGVSFGNFLIKQVVQELQREFPRIDTFVTLSPVPGFMSWLASERTADRSGRLRTKEKEALKLMDRPDWRLDAGASEVLQPVLTRAVLLYLLDAKDAHGKPLDSVARFHLGNGARLERVNWMGDISGKGIREAAGFMVNYLYDLDRIEYNHECYANDNEIVLGPRLRRQYKKVHENNVPTK